MENLSMKYLNALNLIYGLGPQKMKQLIGYFGKAETAWNASLEELLKSGIGPAVAEKLNTERNNINPEVEWGKLSKYNIEILTLTDPNYPALLKEIPSAPYILYIRGEYRDLNSRPMLAIVGSRKFTSYGKQVAERFSSDLARAGIAVVSGLALGIDATAHRGALEGDGKTIAVMGNSLEDEMIAPRSNFNLSQEITQSGLLISDYPLGTPSLPANFPARNRLMAGMTLGTLVIEAAEDSGSLITASLALEFNREVFAVPGSVFSPVSLGTNNLIRMGAKMAAGVKDILEELHVEARQIQEQVKKIIPASPEEEKMLKILTHEPLHIDKIIKLSKLETSVASSTLSLMEMKGMVKNIGGQNYIIIQN
jgi:DNA processing protein